jgi:hypothetical protein
VVLQDGRAQRYARKLGDDRFANQDEEEEEIEEEEEEDRDKNGIRTGRIRAPGCRIRAPCTWLAK